MTEEQLKKLLAGLTQSARGAAQTGTGEDQYIGLIIDALKATGLEMPEFGARGEVKNEESLNEEQKLTLAVFNEIRSNKLFNDLVNKGRTEGPDAVNQLAQSEGFISQFQNITPSDTNQAGFERQVENTATGEKGTFQEVTAPDVSIQPAGEPEQLIEPTEEEDFNAGLQAILDSPDLTEDQRAAIQAIYSASVENDLETSERLIAAMQASAEFSDPFFKAQIRLVTDSLERSLKGLEGDLAFKQTQLENALSDLRADIGASQEHLSFQASQELESLARNYEVRLESNTQAMAATGFTASSRRVRSEGLLKEAHEGAVESTQRQLAFQTGGLQRQLTGAERDVALDVARYEELAAQGKLDILRKAESQVGTKELAGLGFTGLLGQEGVNIGGQIPRERLQSDLSFATSFVF